MIAPSVALVVCALLLVGAGWYVRRVSDRVLQARVRENVIVTMNDGGAFAGVLYEADNRTLVLRNAVEVTASTPVDGELLIRWSEVSFVQKP